jgi:hypothetical protein
MAVGGWQLAVKDNPTSSICLLANEGGESSSRRLRFFETSSFKSLLP